MNGGFIGTFAVDHDPQYVAFRLSTDGDPLQLTQQRSKLRRTKTPRRLLRQRSDGVSILPQYSEKGCAAKPGKMFCPLRGGGFTSRLLKQCRVGRVVGPRKA